MKKILLSLVALICATVSFAQSQIATLSHGDEIKTFYGPSSFSAAMSAATHGDVITLSSGPFVAANITKAVTLRGSGMVESNDSIGFHAPTIIQGTLNISIADSVKNKLAIDGVKFANDVYFQGTLKNPIFTKCNLYSLRYYSTGSQITNAILINCRIRSLLYIYNNSTVTCINSIICGPSRYTNNVNTTFEFVNCVLTHVENSSSYPLNYCTFKNCYLNFNTSYRNPLSSNNIISNCYSSYSDAFKNMINPTNKVVTESNMFASYTSGSWDDSQKFVLKDDAVTKYLGDDGTQIGIYGGNMPYEERISMPYITKCNVAGKSTADGKLSVDIQVEAAQ